MHESQREQQHTRFPQSIDEIHDIMLGDDQEKRRILQQSLEREGISKEQFELSILCQKLRRAVHEKQQTEVKRRVETNPHATPSELAMGAFLEQIEPQVRDAVLLLREKGYATVSSGFSDFNLQAITCVQGSFSNLDPEIQHKLEALGVTIKSNDLSFPCRVIDLATISATWNAIAELLPSRGIPTPSAEMPAAHDFRKRFDEKNMLKPKWKEYYCK